jgi:hypothetical protein
MGTAADSSCVTSLVANYGRRPPATAAACESSHCLRSRHAQELPPASPAAADHLQQGLPALSEAAVSGCCSASASTSMAVITFAGGASQLYGRADRACMPWAYHLQACSAFMCQQHAGGLPGSMCRHTLTVQSTGQSLMLPLTSVSAARAAGSCTGLHPMLAQPTCYIL